MTILKHNAGMMHAVNYCGRNCGAEGNTPPIAEQKREASNYLPVNVISVIGIDCKATTREELINNKAEQYFNIIKVCHISLDYHRIDIMALSY